MRDLQQSMDSDPLAKFTFDFFVYHLVKQMSALVGCLGGIDVVVFTAGIGENSAVLREHVCAGLEYLGIELDAAANTGNASVISSVHSRVQVCVLPTNEELVIARHACMVAQRT